MQYALAHCAPRSRATRLVPRASPDWARNSQALRFNTAGPIHSKELVPSTRTTTRPRVDDLLRSDCRIEMSRQVNGFYIFSLRTSVAHLAEIRRRLDFR
jgi:hypothetical protein